MAEAAKERWTPVLCSLPDEIVIWEILVRLPPKAILRCRAVCRAWRCTTCTRDFLLTHHARQPTLPLFYGNICGGSDRGSLDIIPFDHQAGVTGADQLLSVARLSNDDIFSMSASCDGLLVVSDYNLNFTICNPATGEYAPLQQLDGLGFSLLRMYRHSPTGEHRLLLYPASWFMYDDELPHDTQHNVGSYVFTLGSGQPPRHIGLLDVKELITAPSYVLFHGNLHWRLKQHESPNGMIMVFDTTSESFRQMHPPAVPDFTNLFEMGYMLSVSSFNDAATIVGIWVMQDYEREIWSFKYQVELPVAEIMVQFAKFGHPFNVVAATWDGDVLLLLKSGEWLFHVDANGKLVGSFHRQGLFPTQLLLKQTLVSHTFFPTKDSYAVNVSPFI